jgi:hypothetical protein
MRRGLAGICVATSIVLVVLVVAVLLDRPTTTPTPETITTAPASPTTDAGATTAAGPSVGKGAATASAEAADLPAVLEVPSERSAADGLASSPTMQAVNDAYAVGAERVSRLALAVRDLQSGLIYTAGDVDATYPSASLVKVFIAARLLAEGRAEEPWVRESMWRMIVCSDDDAGTLLYDRAGGTTLMPWVSQYYDIDGLTPPTDPAFWGTTGVTARAMVDFYAKIAADPVVGPWLRDAMGNTQPYGCDGFYQYFGLPSVATAWQGKQGWMCCLSNLTRMHSTGYVNDRWAVALLTEGGTWLYGEAGVQTLTLIANALLPNGAIPTGE